MGRENAHAGIAIWHPCKRHRQPDLRFRRRTHHSGLLADRRMDIYDPSTDKWSRAADMPTSRGFFATPVLNSKIYAIGGTPNISVRDPGIATVEIYDSKTYKWSRGADMPAPRVDLVANEINGKIYAIDGTRHVGVEALGLVEEYDLATGSRTRKADMPTPRLHPASAVIDGKIYVFGGSPEFPVPLAATEMYDPASDTWTKRANMPTERAGLWAALLNGKVYVCGGIGWKNEALATAEEYDPKTDSWRKLPDMPTPRFFLAVEAVGGSVYAIGRAATDFSTLDAVEGFTP